jgi:hypothetical protein
MPDPNSDVFLSYNWRDHAQVEALARRLREQGSRFLDRWYLTPGQSWLKALEATLAQYRAGRLRWPRRNGTVAAT